MIGSCWLVGMRCRGTVIVFVVWVALGTKLLMWKYCMRLVSSDWARFRSSCSVLAVMMRVVSSAYV